MTAKTKGKIALLFLDDGPLILPIGLARRMTDRQLREALWLNVIELKEICGEEIADLASKPIRELTRAEMLDIVARHQHLFNPDMGPADNVRPVHASADMGPARRALPPHRGFNTPDRVRAALQHSANTARAGGAGARGAARAGDVAVGPDPVLGRRCEDRLQDDQHQGGEGRDRAGAEEGVEGTALPDPDRRLL